MMRNDQVRTFIALLWLLSTGIASAQTTVHYAPMTINDLTTWYSSVGDLEITNGFPKSRPGATFPPNTAGVSYGSGFLYVTEKPELIADGVYFNSNFQQGAILGVRTGVAENNSGTDVRIWRIRKDFSTADLRKDAAIVLGITEKSVSLMDMQQLRVQYKKDWLEWPAHKGAPYYDRNGNGIYDPKFVVNEFSVEVPDTSSDAPGLADADQVIWFVFNDLNSASTFNSPNIGMEMQVTVWGYKTTGALNTTIFRRCRFLYKGTAATLPTDSLLRMYAGVWADTDLGQSTDDLAGSDSTAGLSFVYNSKVLDTEFQKYNMVPPSVGYDILQGPIVKGTAVDSALTGSTYRKGWKNLPVTAITYSNPNSSSFSSNPAGIQRLANVFKGLQSVSGAPVINPATQLPTKYWASGDPATKAGWVDGVYESAGERDIILGSGPFAMAVGDTQEIVTAFIAAQSPDRLAAVSVLKYYDKQVQESYDRQSSVPPALPVPQLTVSSLDKSFIIEWEKDTAGVNSTERFARNGYLFQGYELFQLRSPLAPRNEWIKIAAFDIKDEITQILQEDIDPATGRIGQMAKHAGTNSGITRFIMLTRDTVRNAPFINGQQYHFALQSYAYTNNTNALKRSIESDAQIVTVVPHQPDPEVRLPYGVRDSLVDIGENITGTNDGRIGVKIIDPYSVKGGTYDIWYGVSGSAATWTMVKAIAGTDYASISARMTASELTAPRPNPLPQTTGTAVFTLNDARDRIAFTVNVATNSTVTSIEFYSGQKNTIGLQAKKYTTNSKSFTGVWTMTDAAQPLTPQLVSDLIAGYLFVLVRTTQYPNGEMRGQLFDGLVPRTTLPIPDYSTSDRSVMSFPENRFPFDGFSLFVSPAPIGFRSGIQTAPVRGNVINQADPGKSYFLIGPGFKWGASRYHESVIEFRFTDDTAWAITTAKVPAETKFIRVPFRVFKDSIQVVPVVENTFITDSVWNTRGNSFLNGQPLFDKIAGIADAVDFSGNDISYNTVFLNGTFPTSNSLKGRLINGVNHIAINIVVVNVKGDGKPPAPGTVIQLTPYRTIKPGDVKRFTLQPIQEGDVAKAKQQISSVNIFPNPYYGVNLFERELQNRYVTISRLPRKAIVRIFNLAGILVRTLRKDTPDQFMTWDLKNHSGNFVASGVYIVNIEMEGIGSTILKLAVVMEQQHLNSY
jgi:hypothetical protein